MRLFDTHCHLAGTDMLKSAEHYAENAFKAQVEGLAIIAAEEADLLGVAALAGSLRQKYPDKRFVYTAGVHPHDASKIDEQLWSKIEASALGGASAIGETGLDYHYEHSDRKTQQEYFTRHIELAKRCAKPLVIHCREAKDDLLNCLKSAKGRENPGILHCFTEDLDVAKKLIDWGFFISFSGILTFKSATRMQEIAKILPLESMLIETDAPWLAPIPHRGKQNQPAFVAEVFDFLCQLRGLQADELARILWDNSCRVYQIKSN